jgi:hypothetical protein
VRKRQKYSRRLWDLKGGALALISSTKQSSSSYRPAAFAGSLFSHFIASLFNPIHILKSYTWIVIIFYFICYLLVGKYSVLESPFYTVKKITFNKQYI